MKQTDCASEQFIELSHDTSCTFVTSGVLKLFSIFSSSLSKLEIKIGMKLKNPEHSINPHHLSPHHSNNFSIPSNGELPPLNLCGM